MAFHEDFFHVGSILWEAFPNEFPTPDAVRVTLEVTPVDTASRIFLEQELLDSFVVRLLADGMPESAVLHRMFNDQISGGAFPEARSIVWECVATRENEVIRLEVLGSGYWLDALAGVKQFVSRHSNSRLKPHQLVAAG